MRIAWPEVIAVAAIGLVAIESADKPRGLSVAQADVEPRLERPDDAATASRSRDRSGTYGAADHVLDTADTPRQP